MYFLFRSNKSVFGSQCILSSLNPSKANIIFESNRNVWSLYHLCILIFKLNKASIIWNILNLKSYKMLSLMLWMNFADHNYWMIVLFQRRLPRYTDAWFAYLCWVWSVQLPSSSACHTGHEVYSKASAHVLKCPYVLTAGCLSNRTSEGTESWNDFAMRVCIRTLT